MIYVSDGGDGVVNQYQFTVTHNVLNDFRIEMRFYENDTNWTELVHGKVCMKLKNHGNGVVIKRHSGKKIKLDYCEVEELRMLLNYYNEDSGNSRFVFKETKLQELDQ